MLGKNHGRDRRGLCAGGGAQQGPGWCEWPQMAPPGPGAPGLEYVGSCVRKAGRRRKEAGTEACGSGSLSKGKTRCCTIAVGVCRLVHCGGARLPPTMFGGMRREAHSATARTAGRSTDSRMATSARAGTGPSKGTGQPSSRAIAPASSTLVRRPTEITADRRLVATAPRRGSAAC